MKQGWEMKRLDQVCTFINGKAYNKNELLERGKYPVLRVGNFFTNNHWYYSDLELPEDKYCDNGDLLYAWSASFGPRIWTGEKVIYHYHIWKVLPDSKLITKEFLFLLLDWDTEKIKKDQGTGTTMMHVGKGSMDARIVPIPPLLEQQRIVAIVEEAFVAIAKAKANAEQNLKNAKEVFESVLNGQFTMDNGQLREGWEKKIIKEVCELKSGTTISTNLERSEGDVLYVKVGDMNLPLNEVEINTSTRFVNSNEIKSNQIIPNGAIIFPKRGGAIATNKKRKIIKPTIVDLNTMAIIPGNKIDADYFFLWFQLIDLNSISNGTSIPQINNYSFDELKIPFPKSIEAQQTIVHNLDSLQTETHKLEAIYLQKINDLEELKKSILQKAFSGELKTNAVAV